MLEALFARSFRVTNIIETATSIEIEAALSTRIAACPKCGGRVESKGTAAAMVVWDTPLSGKHVRYQYQARRYECLTPGCKTFTDRGPDVHPEHGITWRLWHYIRRLALKWSIKDIARITGASEEQIWPAVIGLADRLSTHKFPTPRIVAVDDIRFGKKRRFTVISDGETGYPLGIVEKLDAAGIGEKLHEVIDPNKAEIFVSDMNGSNLLLGESSFKGIPHVADKWHVLQKMQKPLSRVINQTVNKLKKGPAAELKSWKAELEGKFAAADAKRRREMLAGNSVSPRKRDGDQPALALTSRMDIVMRYPGVRRVYHARLLLRHVYRASSPRQAAARFDRFLAFCAQPGMPAEAAKAAELLGEHRRQILAYFDVMWLHHDGRYRGPTTNAAENRNGKIKAMWRKSRGLRNAAYLNMRVVFEPYVLGATLLLCDACGRSEVVPPNLGLARAGMDIAAPGATRCSSCMEALASKAAA